MAISNPLPSAPILTIAETQVYTGNSPIAWTDLDLSSVIGAQKALVLLKVIAAGGFTSICFRANGDTDEHYGTGTDAGGTAKVYAQNNIAFYVETITDANGIIEWKASGALATTVDIVAFIVV